MKDHNYEAKKVYAPYATSLEYIPWLKDKLWLINFESCWEIHGCEKNNLLPFLLLLKSDAEMSNSKSRTTVIIKSQGQTSRSKVKVNC